MAQPANFDTVVEAHGVLGSFAWCILFPLGGIVIRLLPGTKVWLVHAGIMLFALSIFTINFGTGIWQMNINEWAIGNHVHLVIGILLFVLAWTQPLSGFLHHYLYKKYDKRTLASIIHVSCGRMLILLGIINGGLGLRLGGDGTRTENIAYAIISGLIWLTYISISFFSESKRQVPLHFVSEKTLEIEKLSC